ncbi:DedA family protein [Cyanobium sp. Morenito 9A2]|uniref:DedA family protein n=1 Tax=Cyanobium sp. Morenito 9A2 TaxID=2823718 RepID=UPI0020CC7907|nr:DedA family protein [Cyanobium sp. Morenito 9A2]MCP9848549.1 DedA family protein [Cyanobium sp. Morenito 9A2]
MPPLDLQGFVAALPDVLLKAVETNPLLGYGVIALVMLLENVVPPIPSEVVMPLAGFLVQQGKLELVPVMLAGLLGTVLGAWFWYGVGRLINEEHLEHWVARHGRWLGVHPEALATSRRWFNRHGVAVVFWGRVVPGVRTLVSVPAGMELMPQRTFLLWTTAGSALWLLFLLVAGQALGEGYKQIALWIEPIAQVMIWVVVAALGVVLAWVAIKAIQRLLRD